METEAHTEPRSAIAIFVSVGLVESIVSVYRKFRDLVIIVIVVVIVIRVSARLNEIVFIIGGPAPGVSGSVKTGDLVIAVLIVTVFAVDSRTILRATMRARGWSMPGPCTDQAELGSTIAGHMVAVVGFRNPPMTEITSLPFPLLSDRQTSNVCANILVVTIDIAAMLDLVLHLLLAASTRLDAAVGTDGFVVYTEHVVVEKSGLASGDAAVLIATVCSEFVRDAVLC